jgi:MATE family multidrug resistance protein
MNRANGDPHHRRWRAELGATLSLAWPLILSNLTYAAIQATDVVLMGWLGADSWRLLRWAEPGVAFSLVCLGLVTLPRR